jgi:hypothetical protein
MEEYLDKVTLERIAEIRGRLANRKNCSDNASGDHYDDKELHENNWEFLMIHTSKRV